MGEGGASAAAEPMKDSWQSRKDPTGPTTPPSRKSLRIASWNVRTMYESGKCAQIAQEMQRYKLNILGISETHWTQSGQKRLATGELILYSGRDDNNHREGTAIMVSKQAQKTLRGWEPHGARIIMASFSTSNKNINMNLVQIYSPTNDALEEEKEDFYNRLQGVVDKLPQKDVNIIMGDANAKIGSNNQGYEHIMGKHGLGQMNENGERFADFCAFNSLVIGGSVFKHKRIHQATWVSPDGETENQIDHFCISHRFRRSIEDVKAVRGADVGSDHHLLLAKFRLRLKKRHSSGPNHRRKKFNVSLLQGDKKEAFELQLRNKFQPLEELIENDAEVETHWNMVKEAFVTTCQDVLGERKAEQKEWISQRSLKLIKERKAKKEIINASKTRHSKEKALEEYRTTAKEVKRSLKKDKEEFINRLSEKAEKAANGGHMKILYQTTKMITGKYGRSEIAVKDKDEKAIFGKEAQGNRWVEHFSELLNRPPPCNPPEIMPARKDLPICCDEPTKKEIIDAIMKLNSGKASGPDEIPPEALKADPSTTADILHPLFTKIWNEKEFPKDWKEGHLVKIPKKGDLTKCENYRGITLLSVPGKVFNRVLLDRMKEAVDARLRDEQAGFRKNRSTLDQIATLRIILEQSLEWQSDLIVNFIDYEKAFDSVDQATLWKILRHYGIPQKIVDLIKNMYSGTNCRVLHDGHLTTSFNIKTGVRQGCLLSPFLFILAVDWLMKEATVGRRNGIQWTLWTQLDDLDYADDLALLSHTQEQMQRKTSILDDVSKSIGLTIHPAKSKVLRVVSNSKEQVKLNGQPLHEVDSFCYLGSMIDRNGGTEADIKSRIGKAHAAFTSLNKIWKSRDISVGTKVRLFNSNVKPVLLYGSETWNTSLTNTKRLQTFINKCLRRLLRISWRDRVRNEDVWRRTRQTSVENEIGKRKWRWIGHSLRKDNNSVTKKALEWNPQGTRRRGRPRGTWRRGKDRDMERSGKTWNGVKRLAQDREEWRVFVCGLYPGAG